MKKIILSILFSIMCYIGYSQTYICVSPAITHDLGSILDKANTSLEIGKQFDCTSIGFVVGRTTLNGNLVNNNYAEGHINTNVFQQGKWTNTITVGLGCVISSTTNEYLLTEISSGIEYSYSEKIHFNFNGGQFNYSGVKTASNSTYIAISVAYYFKSYTPKSLISSKN